MNDNWITPNCLNSWRVEVLLIGGEHERRNELKVNGKKLKDFFQSKLESNHE